jgi:hypothetical protein
MNSWKKNSQIHSGLILVSMVGGLMSMAVFYDPNQSQTQHQFSEGAAIGVVKDNPKAEKLKYPHYRGVLGIDARYEKLDEQAAVQFKSITGHYCGMLENEKFNPCRELVMTALEDKKNSKQVIHMVNVKFSIL